MLRFTFSFALRLAAYMCSVMKTTWPELCRNFNIGHDFSFPPQPPVPAMYYPWICAHGLKADMIVFGEKEG